MRLIRKHVIGVKGAALCIIVAMLTACGGGGGGAATTSTGTGTGTGTGASNIGNLTLTGNTGGSSISGLSDMTISDSTYAGVGYTTYTRLFVDSSLTGAGNAILTFNDYGSSGGSYIGFKATPNMTSGTSADWSYIGTSSANSYCYVTYGTVTASMPSCVTWSVAIDRAAGTIIFSTSTAYDSLNAAAGYITGTLSFTPF